VTPTVVTGDATRTSRRGGPRLTTHFFRRRGPASLRQRKHPGTLKIQQPIAVEPPAATTPRGQLGTVDAERAPHPVVIWTVCRAVPTAEVGHVTPAGVGGDRPQPYPLLPRRRRSALLTPGPGSLHTPTGGGTKVSVRRGLERRDQTPVEYVGASLLPSPPRPHASRSGHVSHSPVCKPTTLRRLPQIRSKQSTTYSSYSSWVRWDPLLRGSEGDLVPSHCEAYFLSSVFQP
jgi:hypothetical protein